MKEAVIRHLVSIFKSVADAVDGSDDVSDDVREAYGEAMLNEDVREFYGALVEQRSAEVFGIQDELGPLQTYCSHCGEWHPCPAQELIGDE